MGFRPAGDHGIALRVDPDDIEGGHGKAGGAGPAAGLLRRGWPAVPVPDPVREAPGADRVGLGMAAANTGGQGRHFGRVDLIGRSQDIRRAKERDADATDDERSLHSRPASCPPADRNETANSAAGRSDGYSVQIRLRTSYVNSHRFVRRNNLHRNHVAPDGDAPGGTHGAKGRERISPKRVDPTELHAGAWRKRATVRR